MRAFALTAALLCSNFAHGDPGFLHITFPEIPQVVQQAGGSVYEIHAMDPRSRITINLEEFGEIYDAKIRSDHLLPHAEKIVLMQLATCRARKTLKACEIFTNTMQASAFVMENNHTLWTTLPYAGTPIVLFNGRGDVVYSGEATDEGKAQFQKLSVNVDLGQPLTIAARRPNVNQRIFILGYPIGTGPYAPRTRKLIYGLETRNPLPDSKGDGIFVSIGIFLSAADGTFSTNADTAFGSEGGAIVNEKAELVGMVLAGIVHDNLQLINETLFSRF
ncbi:MAG: hypothetical protein ACXVA9_05265 [Bdellovibrionales bacterium]